MTVCVVVKSNLCETVPRVHFMNVPNVVLPSEDVEQTGVGVVELKDTKKNNHEQTVN